MRKLWIRLYYLLMLVIFTGALFGCIIGLGLIASSEYHKLGNQIFAGSATLLVFVFAVTSVSDRKQSRSEFPLEESFVSSSDQELDLYETNEFLKPQEKMNIEGWNTNDFTEPPATGGRGDHEP